MANIIVSGAGSPQYDGTYADMGLDGNGNTFYQYSNYQITFDYGFIAWVLLDVTIGLYAYYENGSVAQNVIPSNANGANWLVGDAGFPAPTFSEAASGPVVPTVTSYDITSEQKGAQITITGSAFSGVNAISAVSFNGTSATFTVTGDTKIVTIVPVGATTGPISVTNPQGTGTGPSFTVLAPITENATTLLCQYRNPTDTNGAFYAIGNVYRTGTWTNPFTAGKVTAWASSGQGASLSNIGLVFNRSSGVFHTGIDGSGTDTAGAHLSIDVGSTRSIQLHGILYKQRFDDSYQTQPTAILVQGSNNGTTWTTLLANQAVNINTAGASTYIPYRAATAYRFFRFKSIANTTNSGYFTIGELELYGALNHGAELTPAKSNSKVLTTTNPMNRDAIVAAPLAENVGTATKNLVSNAMMSFTGATWATDGGVPYLDFAGSAGNRITFDNNFADTDSFAIEMRLRLLSQPGSNATHLFTRGQDGFGGYSVLVQHRTDGKIDFRIYTGVPAVETTLTAPLAPQGQWFDLVVALDRSTTNPTMKVYYGGVLVATSSSANLIPPLRNSTVGLRAADRPASGTSTGHFPDHVDFCRVWSIRKTDFEIFNLGGAPYYGVAVNPPTATAITPTTGAANTVVTITGTQFLSATGVSYNGVAATYTVNSDTSITATVPAGTIDGFFTVHFSDNAVATPNFNVPANATITSISPTDGIIGSPVVVTGTNLSNITAVTLNGVAATYKSESPTRLIVTVPNATSGPIAVTTADNTATSASFTVRNRYIPVMGYLAEGTLGAIASGATLTDSSPNGKNGIVQRATATYVAGKRGNAIKLPGGVGTSSTASYVDMPANLMNGMTEFTMCGWVNIATHANWGNLFTIGTSSTNYLFFAPKTNVNAARFAIKVGAAAEQGISWTAGTAGIYTATFPVNTWKHMAVTYAANAGGTTWTAIIYIDGVELARIATLTFNPNSLGNTTTNRLGRSQFSADPFLNGAIDEMLLFDKPLSPTEVAYYRDNTPVFSLTNPPSVFSYAPSSAVVGAAVTISGNGFTTATAVSFNGTSSPFTIVSDTTITTTVPSGATTGAISVTNAYGTTSGPSFTVAVAPTITSINPTSGGIGQTVIFNGTDFTGVSAVRFNGTSASFTVNSSTQITATSPASTTGAVSVVTPGGTATGPTYTYVLSSVNGTTTVPKGWYKAGDLSLTNNASVTSWVDKSGRGNALTHTNAPAAPTFVTNQLDGKPIVRLPGNSYLKFPFTSPGGNGMTWFVVTKGSEYQSLIRFQTSGHAVYPWSQNQQFILSNDGGTQKYVYANLAYNTWNLGTARWKRNTVNGHQTFLNGAVASQQNSNDSAITAGDEGFIGVLNNFGSYIEYSVADIAEIIIYDVALTDDERIAVENYLHLEYPTIPGDATVVDTTSPTIASATIPTDGTYLDITYSEPLASTPTTFTGFSVLVNGVSRTLTSAVRQSSTVARLTFSSPVYSGQTVTYSSSGSEVKDPYGNFVIAQSNAVTTNSSTVVPDVTAPTVVSAVVVAVGTYIDVTVSEALAATPTTFTGFTLKVNTVARTLASATRQSNTVIRLTPSTIINQNETVTYTYTGNQVEDVAGNDLVAFDDAAVTNNSTVVPDVTAPTVSSAAVPAVGTYIDITYSETLAATPTTFTGFSTKVAGGARSLTSATRQSNTVIRLTFSSVVYSGQAITYSYTGTEVKDVAGNSAVAVSDAAVTNGSTVQAPPTITAINPTTAATGASVVFTGTNFSNVSAVRFNGVAAASYVVNSTTQITAVVPSGASTGATSVVTPGGTATGPTFTFIPAPTITTLSPTSGSIGTVVTITGTNFTGASAVMFNGVAATSFTVNSATSISATVAASATTGNVVVTTPGGTATKSSFSVTPKVVSINPTSAATGASVVITGNTFTGATVVKFGNGTSSGVTINSSTQITATVPATATTGVVTVTTPSGTGTGASFTFIAPPAVTSIAPTSGYFGDSIVITGTAFTGATAVSINGIAVTSFVVNSATQITAVVGNNTTTGAISIVGPGGTGTGGTFTLVTPVPSVTGIAPTSGSVGAGVVITGTYLNWVTSVKFNGGATASFVINSNTQITATVPTLSFDGPITLVTQFGTIYSPGFSLNLGVAPGIPPASVGIVQIDKTHVLVPGIALPTGAVSIRLEMRTPSGTGTWTTAQANVGANTPVLVTIVPGLNYGFRWVATG